MSIEILVNNWTRNYDLVKVGQEAVENYDYYFPNCDERFTEWLSWYKYYMFKFNTADYPFRSKLFVNTVFAIIQTMMPRLFTNLFAVKPYIFAKGTDEQSEQHVGQFISAINRQYDYPQFPVTMYDWLLQSCWYGISSMKQMWRYKTQDIMLPAVVDSTFKLQEYTEVLFDQPYFETVNQRNIIYPDDCKFMQEKEWIIERISLSDDYIKRQGEAGAFRKEAVAKVLNTNNSNRGSYGDDHDIEQERSERREATDYPTDRMAPNRKRKMYLNVWNQSRNYYAVVHYDTKEVMKIHPSFLGIPPLATITPMSIPHETEGMSMIKTIYDISEYSNATRNLGMDNLTYAMGPVMLYKAGSGIDPGKIVRRPNAWYPVTGELEGKTKLLDYPGLPQDFYKMLNLWAGDVQLVTGINDYTQGQGSRQISNETATGMALLIQEANQRFKMMIELIKAGIQEMVTVQRRLNRAYWRSNKQIPGVDIEMGNNAGKYITVGPETFLFNYDYMVGASGSPDVSPPIQKQQWIELMSILSKIPPEEYAQSGFKPSFVKILKEWVRLSGIQLDIFDRIEQQGMVSDQIPGQIEQQLNTAAPNTATQQVDASPSERIRGIIERGGVRV